MAHFCKIDDNNTVLEVVVVSNDIATTEQAGIDFLNSLYPNNKLRWVQTSYNGNFRKHFAGIGSTYDADKDAFIHRKPYPSWVLNETTFVYEPPTSIPDGGLPGLTHRWDESTTSWVGI